MVASVKIGNIGTPCAKGAGCYANWRRHLHQKAELCTPIGGDIYAICRKHADPMALTLSEVYHCRLKPKGEADGAAGARKGRWEVEEESVRNLKDSTTGFVNASPLIIQRNL